MNIEDFEKLLNKETNQTYNEEEEAYEKLYFQILEFFYDFICDFYINSILLLQQQSYTENFKSFKNYYESLESNRRTMRESKIFYFKN